LRKFIDGILKLSSEVEPPIPFTLQLRFGHDLLHRLNPYLCNVLNGQCSMEPLWLFHAQNEDWICPDRTHELRTSPGPRNGAKLLPAKSLPGGRGSRNPQLAVSKGPVRGRTVFLRPDRKRRCWTDRPTQRHGPIPTSLGPVPAQSRPRLAQTLPSPAQFRCIPGRVRPALFPVTVQSRSPAQFRPVWPQPFQSRPPARSAYSPGPVVGNSR
jgi:hypothetical protein